MRVGFSGTMLAVGVALWAVPAIGRSAHAAAFDGRWSVLIITDKGECDRAYRYEVSVKSGRVSYVGDAAVDFAGHVSGAGVVKVSVGKGSQRADGVGKLSAQAGRGTWHGRSSSGACAGHWEAERR
jgi:hypothetical protein